MFGTDMANLNSTVIQAAIDRNESEDLDLDWKEADYPRNEGFELAKDVTAFANTIGGIIVIGVREDGAGRATEPRPFDVPTGAAERVISILGSRVSPLLHGIEVREIPAGDDLGYLLIVVPRSPDAPHAVRDQQRGSGLHYPIRLGRVTHHLREYEVAARYRDRYASQSQVVSRVEEVHRDGQSHITTWTSPWLTVSLAPRITGERGVGSTAILAERSFLRRWPDLDLAPPEPTFGEGNTRLIPGVRRAIATQVQTYQGRSTEPHAELHYDGGGFAASNFASPAPETRKATGGPDQIKQDLMEFVLLDFVLFLSHHAVDCGASGECLLKAQQLLAQQTGRSDPAMRTRVFAPERLIAGRTDTTYYPPEDSLVLSGNQTRPAALTASLEELTSVSPEAAVVASHALAADILGEFGIVEPMILRPDGSLDVKNVSFPLNEVLNRWGSSHNMTVAN
ncbi:helix-turn-helix domain-containing protein [Mycobacterium sp. 1245805.9]|uniref:AlbA family DNA-binding domain-containing protein n=1 Tax=Mycobacterium sp. 1245805.9 TaxID=1856862 RepID=UPI0018D2E216|nr:ATP-binding protein [Mycobacterium sp. 1245805.9]